MASKNFKPISQADIDKYWEIFSAYCQGASTITGSQASTILRNSGLPDDSLAKIWDLADIDRDGNLDFEEFCVCMRLIYDVMNGDLKGVPAVLPDFLVPESKAHLVTANSAMAGGGEQFEQPEEDEDDTPGLRDGFDWYMQPKDRAKYEGIYTANAGQHGQLAFGALGELYDEISVPDTDVNNAWWGCCSLSLFPQSRDGGGRLNVTSQEPRQSVANAHHRQRPGPHVPAHSRPASRGLPCPALGPA